MNSIIDNIESLLQKYKILALQDIRDAFGLGYQRALHIAKELEGRGVKIVRVRKTIVLVHPSIVEWFK